MRRHEALADFHYQNASDRPKEILAREWRMRRDVWLPLLDERWRDKLVLDIVTVNGWHWIDPAVDLARTATRRAQRKK